MKESKMHAICDAMRTEMLKIGTLGFKEQIFLNNEHPELEYTFKVSMVNKKNSKSKCVAHVIVDSDQLLKVIQTLFKPKYINKQKESQNYID